MTRLRRSLLALLLIAMAAVSAAAQSALVTQLASFKPPSQVVQGAIAKLPDGRIYGLLGGNGGGAIYQAVPNGAGGYTQTVVYEFGDNEPAPFSSFTPTSLVAAPDGKLYYAGTTLWRFDPGAVTVEHLQGLHQLPNALVMGNDGHTLFGSHYAGQIFSYDTSTGVYHEIPAPAITTLVGVEQMKNGMLLAAYSVNASQGSGSQVLLRRIDPITGVEDWVLSFARGMIAPTKGDDGEIYIETSDTVGRKYYRIDSNLFCFCLVQLFEEPFPTPAVRSIAGVKNGKLYIDRDFNPHRLDLTTTPPRLERLAGGVATSRYHLAADGTLFMFATDEVYALDTNTAVPELTPTPLVATGLINDGVNGFPSDYTEGPDGMLYGISELSFTRHASIFRIDPNTRARALVAEVDLGPESGDGNDTNIGKLVLVDQQLYGTYYSWYSLDSAIFRFDPSTNVVELVRVFPFDYNNSTTGPDGILIHDLALGRDGWLYSTLENSDLSQYWSGTIVRIDPASGAFETLARPETPGGFYPYGPIFETADGIWLGTYYDGVGSSACQQMFRFDAATNTFTQFKDLRTDVEGCTVRLARRADGAIFGTMGWGGLPAASGYGRGNVFRLDPDTGEMTRLAQFTDADPVRSPTGTLSFGADGFLYSSYSAFDGASSTDGLMRINPASGAVTAAATLQSSGYFVNGFFIGSDGRFFSGRSSPATAWSAGVLDAIPVAPASAPFGGTTTISATLKATGIPMAGRTIAFTLNGNAIGSATTDAQGVATLSSISVTGIAVGTHATAIGASFAGEEFFPATSGSGSLTVIDVPTPPTPGLAIGAGFVRAGDTRYDFAFIVTELPNGMDLGGFELRISQAPSPKSQARKAKQSDDRFVSLSLTNVVFGDEGVLFAGPGKWNGRAGYRYEAVARRRSLGVTIFDGANNVVVTFDEPLGGGIILRR